MNKGELKAEDIKLAIEAIGRLEAMKDALKTILQSLETSKEEDPDTCYKHKTYNPGTCCPKCVKDNKGEQK